MSAKPIPDDYPRVIPYLLIESVDGLISFLEDVFDAKATCKLTRQDGTVMHAEARIGDAVIMMGEPIGVFGPMPGSVFVYVEDCDAVFRKAVDAGATPVLEPMDMTHAGERYGGVSDQRGIVWWIATHKEDVTPEEQQRRIDLASHD